MLRRCAEILTAQGQLVYGPVLRKFQVLRRSTRNWRPDILRHSLGLRKSENEALKFCGRGIKVFSSLQQPSAAFSSLQRCVAQSFPAGISTSVARPRVKTVRKVASSSATAKCSFSMLQSYKAKQNERSSAVERKS